MEVKREAVKSSNIESMAYSESKRELEITFKSGGTYLYSDVHLVDIKALREASSFGSTLHRLERERKWPYKRIK